ncbi:Protein of unknown function DUF262 [Sulfitobacter pontiacus]|uniref:GmrSD restriction endonucleases N-terminal domain-containing protein n=1 Tax=Sulfitobacter pontiacus TaxID=60137 RepID=A0A1H2R244_9RHOB|nr:MULTISPECIES: DUF262 domain-containing protein [Sulfitobacter]QPO08232.1 DUF262 domain-containing protein [Sulfitobacter sp. B30-2]SDW13258.1 Protein of unknown function DUF262 [Sulfitobacter pontiacus]
MSQLESLFEEDEAAEGGDDYRIAPSDFTDIFVIPSDWTVSTLRQELVDIVDLEPHFQRRSVWTTRAKSKFIESLILGIPIPQILLAERQDERNQFLVLDGKQRLSSIKEFFEGVTEDGTSFSLQGLTDLKELNGETWASIKDRQPKIARAIDAAAIRTAVIRGWKRDDVLYEIFHRLNSGSVRLSPMELRMSLIRGPFVREAIKQTAECPYLQKMLGLSKPDKRMKDVEVAIRHFAFQSFAIEYRGNLKEFLDEYCRYKNRNFEVGQVIEPVKELEELIQDGLGLLEERAFSRKYVPDSGKYEGAFNRAVFDVLGGSLANLEFRRAALEDVEKFRKLYKYAFENTSFVRSVESTTKSISATKYRFAYWYELIEKEYNVALRVPLIKKND